MYTANARYGDTRSRQSKIQKRRTSQAGSGKRRNDPSIHATSRPWHTSTPGIRMNVSTLGQIAAGNPVAAQYLDRMKLSEMAQKKRGIAESQIGRGYDKMGMAIKRGTHASVSGRRAYGAPNQDTIDRWTAEISGREAKAQSQLGSAVANLRGPNQPPEAFAQEAMKLAGYLRQVEHIKGLKRKIPKRPFHLLGSHNPYF